MFRLSVNLTLFHSVSLSIAFSLIPLHKKKTFPLHPLTFILSSLALTSPLWDTRSRFCVTSFLILCIQDLIYQAHWHRRCHLILSITKLSLFIVCRCLSLFVVGRCLSLVVVCRWSLFVVGRCLLLVVVCRCRSLRRGCFRKGAHPPFFDLLNEV